MPMRRSLVFRESTCSIIECSKLRELIMGYETIRIQNRHDIIVNECKAAIPRTLRSRKRLRYHHETRDRFNAINLVNQNGNTGMAKKENEGWTRHRQIKVRARVHDVVPFPSAPKTM